MQRKTHSHSKVAMLSPVFVLALSGCGGGSTSSDGNGNTNTDGVPVGQIPHITSSTVTISETFDITKAVYQIATGSESVTYTFGGVDKDDFIFDTNTRTVKFVGAPDYGTQTSYNFTITARDDNNSTTVHNVTIKIDAPRSSQPSDTTSPPSTPPDVPSTPATMPTDSGTASFEVLATVNSDGDAVLTANKVSDDPDGNGNFSHQWQRSTTDTKLEAGWLDINGATGESYIPPAALVRYSLRLKTTYEDGKNTNTVVYDTIGNIERGTTAQDYLGFPDQGNDIMIGGAGNDEFRAGNSAGADTFIGGAGTDIVKYKAHIGGVTVTVNAVSGNSGGYAEGDKLFGIEGVWGTDYDDVLRGDDNSNWLRGDRGKDILTGGMGDDSFVLELASYNREKDMVTDFEIGNNKIIISYYHLSDRPDTLAGLKSSANIDWTTTDNDSGSSAKDTIIYELGDNNVFGGTGDDADTAIMVLEDYTGGLDFNDFSLTSNLNDYHWV